MTEGAALSFQHHDECGRRGQPERCPALFEARYQASGERLRSVQSMRNDGSQDPDEQRHGQRSYGPDCDGLEPCGLVVLPARCVGAGGIERTADGR